MKIDVMSDLHLRSNLIQSLSNYKPNSQLLVLLGDICELKYFDFYKQFFVHVSKYWEQVFYVFGNHEYYHSDINHLVSLTKEKLSLFPSIKILDNENAEFEGINFIGSTLWTDFENEFPASIANCLNGISDFYYIFDKVEHLTPKKIIKLFKKNVRFITQSLENNPKSVVLTHHAPSFHSVHEKYRLSAYNGSFYSDLDYLIEKYNSKIVAWLHGHTHSETNYNIGDVKIMAHPKGYENELYHYGQEPYKPLTIEI